jgi:perosamine synthetase
LIPLSDPDITLTELEAVSDVLGSTRLTGGPAVEAFEAAFAQYLRRKHAVAVASGTLGMLLALKAQGIGPGQEVIAPAYSWRETAHAIALAGATPVFSDIDYWAGTLAPSKIEARITPRTRGIIAGNNNGHPAAWAELRELADLHGLVLIEDSTEAIGSRYRGALVGTFGDCTVFDFSQPGPLVCGEGGMVVTDNEDVAAALRRQRTRRPEERSSVVVGADLPYQAGMSELAAALGLPQLKRIDDILARRKLVARWYFQYVKSFEGIKDPYIAPEVDEVRWFLYLVHLGARFSRSSRDAIVEDLRQEQIEAAAYCQPMHVQRRYFDLGFRKGDLFVTEKVADRAVALPFHAHLTEEKIAFIVGTMKDASVNVGAGTAIYL